MSSFHANNPGVAFSNVRQQGSFDSIFLLCGINKGPWLSRFMLLYELNLILDHWFRYQYQAFKIQGPIYIQKPI